MLHKFYGLVSKLYLSDFILTPLRLSEVLKKLNGGFLYADNSGLCSNLFLSLRHCSTFDTGDMTTTPQLPLVGPVMLNHTLESANSSSDCNRASCTNHSHFRQVIILVVGTGVATVMLPAAAFLALLRYRRHKQRIGSAADASDFRFSTDHAPDTYSKSASPMVSLAYSSGWDPLADGLNGDEFSLEALQSFRF